MPATRNVMIAVFVLLASTAAAVAQGQGVSQLRHLPFSGFDLTAIGVVLVIVMVVLGVRAVMRRRNQRTETDTD